MQRSRLPVAKRRFWMNCECPIWIVGRLPGGELVPRQSTGCTDLKDAEAFRAAHIAQFAKAAKVGVAHGPTIADCVEKYIETRRSELGNRTVAQHQRVLDRLIAFCKARKVVGMGDLTVDLLETFKTRGLLAGSNRSSA